MFRLAIVSFMLVFFGIIEIQASEKSRTISEMLKLYSAGTSQYKIMNKLLIGKTGEALGWANSKLRVDGRKALYCPPEKLAMNHEQYLLMLQNAVIKKPTLGSYPMNALGLIILEILIDTFPCPKH
jgi:hypothetical protein